MERREILKAALLAPLFPFRRVLADSEPYNKTDIIPAIEAADPTDLPTVPAKVVQVILRDAKEEALCELAAKHGGLEGPVTLSGEIVSALLIFDSGDRMTMDVVPKSYTKSQHGVIETENTLATSGQYVTLALFLEFDSHVV